MVDCLSCGDARHDAEIVCRSALLSMPGQNPLPSAHLFQEDVPGSLGPALHDPLRGPCEAAATVPRGHETSGAQEVGHAASDDPGEVNHRLGRRSSLKRWIAPPEHERNVR